MTSPSLSAVQEMFQRALLTGDTAAFLALIPDNGRTSRDVLLGVYQHAYVARLVGVMASDHELLYAHMSAPAFDAMARQFIAAHPSRTPNARWFADGLPNFLARTDPYCARPALHELVGLERRLADAFDAPDAPVLTLADLAAIAPADWGLLTFRAHPSTARLDHQSNAFAIWSALKGDLPAPAETLRRDEPDRLLVWRTGSTAMVRALGAEEAMLWDEAGRGATFGRLCELTAVFGDPATAALRAAQHLQAWLSTGALTGLALGARPTIVLTA